MKFLYITRHYPPEVSGGARRPYLFTKALRELGHTVRLITPFHITDDPDAVQVRHPVTAISDQSADLQNQKMRPSTRPTLKDWARQWLCWPEPDIRWAKGVLRYLDQNPIDADWVITTSPPESLHCIGAAAAKLSGAKWLAECRDTWITHPHRKVLENSALRRAGERLIARKAFSTVDAISAVSDAVLNDIRTLAPANTPACVIGHFSAPTDQVYSFDENSLHIVHAGGFTLSDRRRRLDPFLDLVSASGRRDLHIHILGPLTSGETQKIERTKSFRITAHGSVPFDTSRAMQQAADALVLITPENSHALPGKYAEYATTGRPIFFLGGGSWLDLVKHPGTLIPLSETSLRALEKTPSSNRQVDTFPTALHAANKLADFCQKQL